MSSVVAVGELGDLDRSRPVGAGGHDAAIDLVDDVERGGGVGRDDLQDVVEPPFLVAGIDAFRRVADVEILLPYEARRLFQGRDADFLGDARIDRRLVDHDVALLELGAHGCRCALERFQIGLLAGVDRRRNGHDVEVGRGKILRVGGEFQSRHLERGRVDFARPVVALGQLGDPPCVDVEGDDGRSGTRKGGGDGQADIAEPDHGNAPLHLYRSIPLAGQASMPARCSSFMYYANSLRGDDLRV